MLERRQNKNTIRGHFIHIPLHCGTHNKTIKYLHAHHFAQLYQTTNQRGSPLQSYVHNQITCSGVVQEQEQQPKKALEGNNTKQKIIERTNDHAMSDVHVLAN